MKFGCMFLILGVSLTILISSIAIGAKPKGPIWTDPAKAIRLRLATLVVFSVSWVECEEEEVVAAGVEEEN